MALPPIRLLRHSAMMMDPEEPCVLEIAIPIALPHRLDPSLPAPPYHPDTMTAEEFRDSHAMPLLRRLVAQIVFHLFGPEHATAALEAPTQATSPPCGLRLLASWHASTVDDKENDLDFAAGRWKDNYGDEGHGPIDAYFEDPWGRVVIYHQFKLFLVCRVRDATQLKEMNPRVFLFELAQEDSGDSEHELVFQVREYTEYIRRHHIHVTLAVPMEFSDIRAPVVGRSRL